MILDESQPREQPVGSRLIYTVAIARVQNNRLIHAGYTL